MASINVTRAVRKSSAMGPSVRSLLSHYQLEPTKIMPTGPHQTLVKSDVIAYISVHNLQPSNLSQQTSKDPVKRITFTPKLDISGYQPKAGPEGFSRIAKELLHV